MTVDRIPLQLPPMTWTLTQAQIDAYAAAAGANDPIHVDPEFARSTSLGGTIGQGLLLYAVMGDWIADVVANPVDWICGGVLDVRFRGPARPGDRLTVRAVRGGGDADGAKAVRFEVWCERDDGQRLVSGDAWIPEAAF
jgi:acyl dehydratase